MSFLRRFLFLRIYWCHYGWLVLFLWWIYCL